MKRIVVVAFMLAMTALQTFGQSKPAGIDGVWKGSLNAGGQELRLVVTITKSSDGSYHAELNSVDQQAVIPVDTVTVKGDSVKFEVKSIDGEFEGTLNKDGSVLTGNWSQGGTSLPLTLKKEAKQS